MLHSHRSQWRPGLLQRRYSPDYSACEKALLGSLSKVYLLRKHKDTQPLYSQACVLLFCQYSETLAKASFNKLLPLFRIKTEKPGHFTVDSQLSPPTVGNKKEQKTQCAVSFMELVTCWNFSSQNHYLLGSGPHQFHAAGSV